jgi:hypothetical protein
LWGTFIAVLKALHHRKSAASLETLQLAETVPPSCQGKIPSRTAGETPAPQLALATDSYFCATNSLARLNSGRVEFDPSQTFSSSA